MYVMSHVGGNIYCGMIPMVGSNRCMCILHFVNRAGISLESRQAKPSAVQESHTPLEDGDEFLLLEELRGNYIVYLA